MRKRILVNYIIILVISALITGALAFYFVNNNYIKNKEEMLLTNSLFIESILEDYYREAADINYFKLVQNLSKTTNIRVTFLDMSGRPIADSLNNSIIFSVDPYSQEFNNSYTGENSLVRRYSKEAGEKYFFLTTGPIELANDRLILRVGDTYNESDHVIEEVLNYFLISLIISMLLAIPFSYFLAGYIVGPIKELTKASKSIAGGDFNNKIKINSKDEIGELALSFNQMGKDLDQRIKEINNTNRKINSILTSIQDGILALDLDGNVISVNDGVKKNLGISRDIVIGENIKKTFDSLDYMKNIKEDLMSTREYYIEVKIKEKGKIISIDSYPIIGSSPLNKIFGTLIIIRDITDIRNLEKMRKDFVANVSHELRTPLTSIIGFVETLKIKELDEKNREKALDIIEYESKRLQKLINELLKLSKMQSDIDKNLLEEIRLEDVIWQVVSLLEPQIAEKDIKVEFHVEKNINPIYGDIELIKLIVINLVHNAIKYNKYGGNLDIELKNYQEGIELVVEDSGLGIPKDDIPWIFERFYQVDKSRSKREEGSGLGLAIVKEIVEGYGGKVECTSQLGKGSKFTIRIYP